MVCGTCGATIAAKAIVCYRCGAPTAVPAPPPRPQAPAARPWIWIVLLLAVAAVLGWLASAEPAGSVRQLVLAAVGACVVAGSGYLAFARRGR